MQSAGSSKSYERVIPRVVAAFDGDFPHSPFDDRVRNAENSLCEFFDRAETSFALFQFAASSFRLQNKSAIQQSAPAEVTQHGMSVGHCWQISATVANRSRV